MAEGGQQKPGIVTKLKEIKNALIHDSGKLERLIFGSRRDETRSHISAQSEIQSDCAVETPSAGNLSPEKQIQSGTQSDAAVETYIGTPSAGNLSPEKQKPGADDFQGTKIEIEIESCEPSKVEEIMGNKEDPVYTMSSYPRGRALVINNKHVKGLGERDGADKDLSNIETLFTKLGFQVVKQVDCTAQQIKDIIQEEANNEMHRNSDCFICFILSHGSLGFVLGTDGEKVSIEDDVILPLDNERCQMLKGKPKVFFFQACQNEPPQQDGDTDSNLTKGEPEEDGTRPLLEHPVGDTIISHSTVPGYAAYREGESGSWFVKAIFEVFTERAHVEDLLSMLTKVRHRVHENYKRCTGNQNQLTETRDRAEKKLFFFPGYFPNKPN